MQLEITAVGGQRTAPFPPMEMSLDLPEPEVDAGDLLDGQLVCDALAQWWPESTFTVSGMNVHELRVGVPPLIDGAVVIVEPHITEQDQPGLPSMRPPGLVARPGALAMMMVKSGPGAGALFPLTRGNYRIGRGHCQISIADPLLSRHHGTLTVGQDALTLAPAAESSGFTVRRDWVNVPTASARHVKGPTNLHVGDLVECGMSTFAIVLAMPADPRALHGQASLSVPPLISDLGALTPIVLADKAGFSRGRWAMVAAGLLPLLLGVVFAWLTGSLMFLAFAGMGAVTVLLPLIGGVGRRRTFSASVTAATEADAFRRTAAFPDAGSLMAAAQRTAAVRDRMAVMNSSGDRDRTLTGNAPVSLPSDSSRPIGATPRNIALRLGTAEQSAQVTLGATGSGFVPPLIPHMPFTVPVIAGRTVICGASHSLRQLLHFVLMQLDAANVPVVIWGSVDELPLPARFLANTVLAVSAVEAGRCVDSFGPLRSRTWGETSRLSKSADPLPRCVVVCLNATGPLADSVFPGVPCLHFSSSSVKKGAAAVTLDGRSNPPTGTAYGLTFVPDGVPAVLFERYARCRANASATPKRCLPLLAGSIPPPNLRTVTSIAEQWKANANGPLVRVPVGVSPTGKEYFDFSHDGPHLLVGGTTGSGKSEFLRTLVGSLAVEHSPQDLEFIFIDFKGGAGLGALSRFPHTTSLITDLDGHGMERTLTSLRAEIRTRESALGQAGASDINAYRILRSAPSTPAVISNADPSPGCDSEPASSLAIMAHLVLVIDEFRVLTDQHPDVMAELMRIAAVGRSLGIHLVMATQRPQGAINADIRANVTTSVCLRVQTSIESQDILGSGVAASISVNTPGRAFISRAGTEATPFHCATLRLPTADRPTLPTALSARNRLTRLAGLSSSATSMSSMGADSTALPQESDIIAVTHLLDGAWALMRPTRAAPTVIAAQLPNSLGLTTNHFKHHVQTSADAMNLPFIDLGLMDIPERQSLEPLLWSPDKHSHLACVGAVNETSRAVAMTLFQLAHAMANAQVPPTFIYVLDGDGSLNESHHKPFVGGYVGPDNLRTAARLVWRLTEVAKSSPTRLMVFLTDFSHWVSAFRSSPWAWAEDMITDLVRHRSRSLTVVIGGGRELLSAAFIAAIPNRLFIGHGATRESRLLWPPMPAYSAVAGRAVVFGAINAPVSNGPAEIAHVAQLWRLESPQPTAVPVHGRRSGAPIVEQQKSAEGRRLLATVVPPLSVRPLPEYLTLSQTRCFLAENTAHEIPPSSGRIVIILGIGGDGTTPITVTVPAGTVLPVVGGPGTGKSTFLMSIRAINGPFLAHPEDTQVWWLDDADSRSDAELTAITKALSTGSVAIVAFPHHLPSLARYPFEWGLRCAERGIVLSPSQPQDGEMFGVRLDTQGREPPGRAVLLDRGRREWFQFPVSDSLGPRTG